MGGGRLRRDLSRRTDSDFPRGDKLGLPIFQDLLGTGNRAQRRIKQFSSPLKMQICILPLAAVAEFFDLRRHHCALAFVQMPATKVQADDVARLGHDNRHYASTIFPLGNNPSKLQGGPDITYPPIRLFGPSLRCRGR